MPAARRSRFRAFTKGFTLRVTCFGLSSAQLTSFLALLNKIEEGWEAVVPAEDNPLARRGGPRSTPWG